TGRQADPPEGAAGIAQSVHLASAAGPVCLGFEPAPNADVCLHDLSRWAGECDGVRICLAHAEHHAADARLGQQVRLVRQSALDLSDVRQAVYRSGVPEVPSRRRGAGAEREVRRYARAACDARISLDPQVWLLWLP